MLSSAVVLGGDPRQFPDKEATRSILRNMPDLFDAEAMYDADYLHFFASPGGGEKDAELIWRLLELEPGMRVLDLGCGHGHIANQLARRGARVTGLDSSSVFLDRARADAAALGIEVEYVEGDMRALPWTDSFDRIVNWSTAFGYFDDDVNREVLARVRAALVPSGRLGMDLNNLVRRLTTYTASRVLTAEDGAMLVDRFELVPTTNRLEVERTIIRDGRARRVPFVVRLFGFPEIRDWLLAAGFASVTAYGEDAEPLAAHHDRMILTATT